MEALGLSRVWAVTTTRAGRECRSGVRGVNFESRSRRSMHNAMLCSSGGRGCVAEKRKIEYNETVLGVGLERGRFGLVQGSLLQQQYHFQRRGESMSCASNGDKSGSSAAAVAVVSEDDVEVHRKELLARYCDEGFEVASIRRESDDDEDELTEGQGEVFVRCRDAGQQTQQTQQRFWWKRLNIRRMLTPRTKGILLLNIVTFLYGSNISIIKSAGATMDPTLFSVGRFAVASLAFTPFFSHAVRKPNLRNASVELGLWASAGYLTQSLSLLTSDASRFSFISTFTVIVVPLLAGLSGAKISKITWIAAATALVGVGILESNGTPFAIGDVWSFVSAMMFGVHLLRTEHHSKTLAQEDSLPIMALQLVVITLYSGVWFCASHLGYGDLTANFSAPNWPTMISNIVSLPWLPFLYSGLLSTAFCLWAELVSMRDVKATEAAVIYTTEPLWGAAFAWLTLGERWGSNGWLGAFFILGGSLTMQLFGHPDAPALKKIVEAPPRLDLIVGVDSSLEEEQPVKRTMVSDVSITVLHKEKRMARKPVKASRRDN